MLPAWLQAEAQAYLSIKYIYRQYWEDNIVLAFTRTHTHIGPDMV